MFFGFCVIIGGRGALSRLWLAVQILLIWHNQTSGSSSSQESGERLLSFWSKCRFHSALWFIPWPAVSHFSSLKSVGCVTAPDIRAFLTILPGLEENTRDRWRCLIPKKVWTRFKTWKKTENVPFLTRDQSLMLQRQCIQCLTSSTYIRLFWIWCQQHLSNKLRHDQQEPGKIVGCSKTACLEQSTGKLVNWGNDL